MPHKIPAKPLRAKLPSNKMPSIFSKIIDVQRPRFRKMAIGPPKPRIIRGPLLNLNYRPSHTREPPRFKKLNIFKKNFK
jgi:hypothetical protein